MGLQSRSRISVVCSYNPSIGSEIVFNIRNVRLGEFDVAMRGTLINNILHEASLSGNGYGVRMICSSCF